MRLRHISTTIGVSLVALISATDAATVDLPQTAALPAGSSSTRGFLVRTAQGPEASILKNNATRALNQINGTLVDAEGALVPNEAFPGPLTGGAYAVDTASFEKDATQVDVIDVDQNLLASFSSFSFPGIPGSGNHTDNFAAEVVGLVALPAGVTTFGVSSSTGRTDTENDDGFVVTVGTPPSDFFGVKIGEFQRNAPPFASNYRNETQFSVNAPVAGLYPLRLLFWQTGFGANLNWYTILESGERILLNDTGLDARALQVFQDSTVASVNAPYIAEVRP
ncbi:MAG: hypothetical protein JNL10_00935, partial [Verrucomicrobiales bacterium]|nr:hypothetical protein [Verrucomicrobiales bacterium]